MSSFRTILHPTDFSTPSAAALKVARVLARSHSARLVLVHVVPYERVPGAVQELATDLEVGREALERLRHDLLASDPKLSVEVHLRCDCVPQEIVDEATETSTDLIVIGTHGRTGLRRLLVGRAAESVLQMPPCPVVSVKTPEPGSTARGESPANVATVQ